MTDLTSAGAATTPTQDTPPVRRGGDIHHGHRDVTGGWLRPAVFGAMDGLVSNTSLIAGVAAASAAHHTILLTGLAGLLAGSFSMAVGEWTSVTSQRELIQAEIDVERAELERAPHAEERELAGMFRARGLSRELASLVAHELSQDPDQTWRVHVREELGVDPDDQPSAYLAGASSFASFAIGAFVPLLPYLLGATSVIWTFVLAGAGLLAVGGAVARFTSRPTLRGAVRQLAIGAAAVAVVFGVGAAIGTGVS